MKEIEVKRYDGEGYLPLVRFETWRVAALNYEKRFDRAYFTRMERHHLTDEVFVLLAGHATLVIGGSGSAPTELRQIEMEPETLYNVKKDGWHHIFVSRDARVLVIENEDTSPANTEYADTDSGML